MTAGIESKLGSLTFTLEETADICLMRPRLLHRWIEDGRLTPAVPGSKGRGLWHRFSPMQLIGLAIAAGMAKSKRGCSLAYVEEVLTTFSAMSESALEHWLAIRRDVYSEEARAVFDQAPIFGSDDDVSFMMPSDVETIRDVVGRVERVEEAIRRRLGLSPEDRELAIKSNRRR
jgi:hypothetical protein